MLEVQGVLMDIQIKDVNVLAGLMGRKCHPMLITVACWIAESHGLYMTESYRNPYHPGDLHAMEPLRAIDLRHRFYNDPESVAKAVNEKFQYDPGRPGKLVAFVHKNRNSKGIHFHIQVHDNTVEIDDKKDHTGAGIEPALSVGDG